MQVSQLIIFLNEIAPEQFQESYDNAGLITGHPDMEIKGVLIALDCIESIVDEAIHLGCNVIVAHHPIVFGGMKRFNGSNYVERTIIKAIKNDIAIYAIHTNLDNVIHGVNHKIAEKLELTDIEILSPKPSTLEKITTFVPEKYLEEVASAMHKAGAGQIGNYKDCSFRINGIGTFTPAAGSNPFTGTHHQKSYESEARIEMIFPSYLESKIINALKNAHPYEEVAYYIHTLQNHNQEIGAGITAYLKEAKNTEDFLIYLKEKMEIPVIKHTTLVKDKIKKIAICGGAGSFLTKAAINSGADIYISSDYKYHEFFDADGKIIIADIGHFESEKYTIDLLYDLIINNFSTFATHYTKIITNPIKFY